MLSLLTITTLYPNPIQPAHGAFVATRLRELLYSREVQAEVIAPVPWMPSWLHKPSLGRLDLVPADRREGEVIIHHPRYLVVPKVGMNVTPYTLYYALKKKLTELLREGKTFDIIDAHYFYPDGIAAVWLGLNFGIPVCVTARGTDINLIPEYALPRRMIMDAAKHADGIITVCQALKDRLVELGTAPSAITVLRNGVDLKLFRPIDRIEARKSFGCTRTTLGSVGLLIERKGHHHIIEALKYLPDMDLLIIGDGPEKASFQQLAQIEGVTSRIRFLGLLDQAELVRAYNAMDALVLASSREGWANVLLEAMACGTPVVASSVWGTPEVVASPEAGILMKSVDAQGVVEGVRRLFADYPDHASTRCYAEGFSWKATTQGQLDLFSEILSRSQPNRAA
jgi:teichuronic acid biosynthesis glycosyltransferase TuaC